MSNKPGEEGWFWEWRTFGELPALLVEAVEAYELRGEPGIEGEDLYLISASTDQNVKLRGDGLKLKPLLVELDDGLELYEESARLAFDLPASPDAIAKAASLLGVHVAAPRALGRDELLALIGPGVVRVEVLKRRTQYVVGDGWVELAELEFPAARVRSLGIQSSSLAETRRIRDLLDPGRALAPINYVDACRRWIK
jgi:hypothetical protein